MHEVVHLRMRRECNSRGTILLDSLRRRSVGIKVLREILHCSAKCSRVTVTLSHSAIRRARLSLEMQSLYKIASRSVIGHSYAVSQEFSR